MLNYFDGASKSGITTAIMRVAIPACHPAGNAKARLNESPAAIFDSGCPLKSTSQTAHF